MRVVRRRSLRLSPQQALICRYARAVGYFVTSREAQQAARQGRDIVALVRAGVLTRVWSSRRPISDRALLAGARDVPIGIRFLGLQPTYA